MDKKLLAFMEDLATPASIEKLRRQSQRLNDTIFISYDELLFIKEQLETELQAMADWKERITTRIQRLQAQQESLKQLLGNELQEITAIGNFIGNKLGRPGCRQFQGQKTSEELIGKLSDTIKAIQSRVHALTTSLTDELLKDLLQECQRYSAPQGWFRKNFALDQHLENIYQLLPKLIEAIRESHEEVSRQLYATRNEPPRQVAWKFPEVSPTDSVGNLNQKMIRLLQVYDDARDFEMIRSQLAQITAIQWETVLAEKETRLYRLRLRQLNLAGGLDIILDVADVSEDKSISPEVFKEIMEKVEVAELELRRADREIDVLKASLVTYQAGFTAWDELRSTEALLFVKSCQKYLELLDDSLVSDRVLVSNYLSEWLDQTVLKITSQWETDISLLNNYVLQGGTVVVLGSQLDGWIGRDDISPDNFQQKLHFLPKHLLPNEHDWRWYEWRKKKKLIWFPKTDDHSIHPLLEEYVKHHQEPFPINAAGFYIGKYTAKIQFNLWTEIRSEPLPRKEYEYRC